MSVSLGLSPCVSFNPTGIFLLKVYIIEKSFSYLDTMSFIFGEKTIFCRL